MTWWVLAGCISWPSQYRALEKETADVDGDGFTDEDDPELEELYGLLPGDCDDNDPRVNPGAVEVPYNDTDDDCDVTTSDVDVDADGFEAVEVGGDDCDDTDPDVHPYGIEVWYDGVDQDCSGGSDFDQDGDGADHVDHGGEDCDDQDASVDGAFTFYEDLDGDGYGTSATKACELPEDHAEQDGDCDDGEAQANPGLDEACGDGIDNDCDAATDCRLEAGALSDRAATLVDTSVAGFASSEFIPGRVVAHAGDTDGDGLAEFAVGSAACVYLFEGPTWPTRASDAHRAFCDQAAKTVDGAIDVDLDGLDDVAVAASGGVATVYSGADGSPLADFQVDAISHVRLVDQLEAAPYGAVVLTHDGDVDGETHGSVLLFQSYEGWGGSFDADDGVRIASDDDGRFGTAVASADFAGTGLSGLLISAYQADADAGAVYAFESPLDATTPADADWVLGGPSSGAQFGATLGAADLDDDGYPELWAAAPNAAVIGAEGGAVYVLPGPTDAPSLDDATVVFAGAAFDETVWNAAFADVDADGATDAVVSTPAWSSLSGGVAVAYGPWSGTVAVEDMVQITSDRAGGFAGSSVLGLQFDQESGDDLVISAPWDGRVYLLSGSGI